MACGGVFFVDIAGVRRPVAIVAGPILAVECKGADRWAGTEDDRLIGGLWANLSEGRCRFVMVKDKRWEWIEEKLNITG